MRPTRAVGQRAAASTLAALLAAGLSACGSGVARVSGSRVFATDCAVCHSISGHSSPTQQGGDLRALRLPRRELVQYTAEMPAVNGRLTRRDVRAVVSYLLSVERR